VRVGTGFPPLAGQQRNERAHPSHRKNKMGDKTPLLSHEKKLVEIPQKPQTTFEQFNSTYVQPDEKQIETEFLELLFARFKSMYAARMAGRLVDFESKDSLLRGDVIWIDHAPSEFLYDTICFRLKNKITAFLTSPEEGWPKGRFLVSVRDKGVRVSFCGPSTLIEGDCVLM